MSSKRRIPPNFTRILSRFLTLSLAAVLAETCQIAIDRILFEANRRAGKVAEPDVANPYHTVDPAPALPPRTFHIQFASFLTRISEPIDQLVIQMMDSSLSLFDRYRAVFALRNEASAGNVKAVLALNEGFKDTSALFRHEIGYVLGQVADPASVPALVSMLENHDELAMVRHECAEGTQENFGLDTN